MRNLIKRKLINIEIYNLFTLTQTEITSQNEFIFKTNLMRSLQVERKNR